jgi:hypothetical protein
MPPVEEPEQFNQIVRRFLLMGRDSRRAKRFKSVLVQGGEAPAAIAAYIDLNPVRAGPCAEPNPHFSRLP